MRLEIMMTANQKDSSESVNVALAKTENDYEEMEIPNEDKEI